MEMRKNVFGVLSFILLAILMPMPEANAAKANKQIKICVSLPTEREEHWVRDALKNKKCCQGPECSTPFILLQAKSRRK
jgi:ABC-type xylose transport system substrate-binding protein